MLFWLIVSFFVALNDAVITENKELVKLYTDYKKWKQARAEFVHLSRDYPVGWKNFRCDFPAERYPSDSIHTLAPWNVNVVASLGDSLSAGRSTDAQHLEDLLKDSPGLAFVSGTDRSLEEEVTLANIFKHYNPALVEKERVINVAKTGAFSSDLMRQVLLLDSTLKRSKKIDFENDWKFINVFIGSNDVCKQDQNRTFFNPDQYYLRLKASILYIKEHIPRSFVNLMPPLSVQLLRDTHENPFCLDFHQYSCTSLLSMNLTDFIEEKRKFDDMVARVVEEIPETDTFAVVGATTISKVDHLPRIGNLPNIAFPALDCFHFSVMAVDMVAKLLWKGLFEDAKDKEVIKSFEDFNPKIWECPPPTCPFLRTATNTPKCSVEKIRYPSLPRDPDAE